MTAPAKPGFAELFNQTEVDPELARIGREFLEFVRAAEAEAQRRQIEAALEEIRVTRPTLQ